MGLLESIERTVFLGEEFLTWLWYRAETEPRIELGQLGAVAVELGDALALRGSEDQDAIQVSLKGERAGASQEARAALREGKKLWKCKIRFKQGDEVVWPCSLNADSLAIGGLRPPVPKGVPMPDGLIMRAEKLEEFVQIYFRLFEVFLEQRLNEKHWKKLETALRKWVMAESACGEPACPEPVEGVESAE